MSFQALNNIEKPRETYVIRNNFEEQYLSVRRREQRIYTDEDVAKLPEFHKNHPHYKEWLIRKKSSQQLVFWLKGKKQKLKVLEIGCGNGWLSSRLSKIENCEVVGLDINRTELDQASRVFNQNESLVFKYGDIRTGVLKEIKFDTIVFAASVQYFPSLEEVLNTALYQLRQAGEIHIVDTCFYKENELPGARERTRAYFSSLGFPAMSACYFHHGIDEFRKFNHQIIYDPNLFINKIFRNRHPFHWICIKNS